MRICHHGTLENSPRDLRKSTYTIALGGFAGLILTLALLRVPVNALSVTPGTNVSHVSIVRTQGTNHTFYYRGKIRWMWNVACKRLGWHLLADSERQHSRTFEPAEMMWVVCKHRGEALDPRLFQALEVTADGRKRIHSSTGGVCDRKRGVSVSHWALVGGAESHRGSVIYVKWGRKEMARIEVR